MTKTPASPKPSPPPKPAQEAAEPTPHCDNHPDRAAKVYTGGGSYLVTLCDECTPSWFANE